MADLFPDFSLGILFDPDVLYDLEDENKNELLRSPEVQNAIRNNTNNSVAVSEISEHVQVTDENTEPRPASNSKNKQPNVCEHVKRWNWQSHNESRDEKHQSRETTQNGLSEVLKVLKFNAVKMP